MAEERIPSLTAVIPVSRMAGQLTRLNKTLLDSAVSGVFIILVHDIQDEITGPQIRKLDGFTRLLNLGKIRFLEGKFGAPGTSRNSALELIHTKWTVFWDADDSPDVMGVISMIMNAENFGFKIALGDFEEIDFWSGATIRKPKSFKKLGTVTQTALNPGLWRWAFQTSRIQNLRFQNILMGEDQLFLIHIDPFFSQFYVHPKVVYRYSRNRQGQLTSDASAIDDLNQAVRLLCLNADKFRNAESKLFLSIIFWRLSITNLKHASNLLDIIEIIFKPKKSSQIKRLGSTYLLFGLFKVVFSKK
jgi:hypothetical protein